MKLAKRILKKTKKSSSRSARKRIGEDLTAEDDGSSSFFEEGSYSVRSTMSSTPSLLSDGGLMITKQQQQQVNHHYTTPDEYPRRVIVSILKPTPSTYSGLIFHEEDDAANTNGNGKGVIAYIGEKGLFADTILRQGDELVSVDGFLDWKDANAWLKTGCGRITVEVIQRRNSKSTRTSTTVDLEDATMAVPLRVAVQVQKDHKDCQFGISIQENNNNGGMKKNRSYLSISKANKQYGLLGPIVQDHVISQGCTTKIDRINGKSCPTKATSLVQMLKSSFPMVMLEFVHHESGGVQEKAEDDKEEATLMIPRKEEEETISCVVVNVDTIIFATVEKPNPETKVGISLRQSAKMDDSIMICSISKTGLFAASSGLKVGQKVLTINGAPCPKDTIEAAKVIAKTVGTLTIEAAEIDWGATFAAGEEETIPQEDGGDGPIEGESQERPHQPLNAEHDEEEEELMMQMMKAAGQRDSTGLDDEDDHDYDDHYLSSGEMMMMARNKSQKGDDTTTNDELDAFDDLLRDLQEDLTEAYEIGLVSGGGDSSTTAAIHRQDQHQQPTMAC